MWRRALLLWFATGIAVLHAHQPHDHATALLLSPTFASDRTVFAGVRHSLMKSVDAGDTWAPVTRGIRGNVRALHAASDFATTNRMYALVSGQGLVRSDDRGSVWHLLSANVKQTLAAPFAIARIARSDRLYRVDRKQHLHHSDDQGDSWTREAALADQHVTAVFSAGGVTLAVSEDGKLRRRDESASPGGWRLLGTPPAEITALGRTDDGTLLVATRNGLYRVGSNGNWRLAVFTDNRHINGLSRGVNGARHWLATSRQHAVLTSMDDGRTWRRVGFGMRKHHQADDYGAAHFSGVVQASDGTAFLASFSGVLRSDASLQKWQQLATLDDHNVVALDMSFTASDRPMLLVSTYLAGAALVTQTAAGTWLSRLLRPEARRGGHALFLQGTTPDTPRIMLASGSSRLYYSDDLGHNWQASQMPEPLPGRRKYPDAVTGIWPAADGRTLFAGHRPLGLLRSDDGGQSFSRVWDGDGASVWHVAVSPAFATDATVYATTREQLHRSTDGARTWTAIRKVKRPQPDVFVSAHFERTQRVWLSDRRLLFSEDAGNTWRPFLPGLLNGPVARGGFASYPAHSDAEGMIVQPWGEALLRLRLSADTALVDDAVAASAERPELPAQVSLAHIHSSGRDRSRLIVLSPDFARDQTVVAASDRRVFMSTDAGRRWRPLPVSLLVRRDSKQVRYRGRWWPEERLTGAHTGAMLSGDPTAAVEITFTGTGIEWTCIRLPQGRAEVDIWLDGARVAGTDLRSSDADLDSRCYRSPELPRGPHRLRVRAAGGGNNSVLTHRAFVVTP